MNILLLIRKTILAGSCVTCIVSQGKLLASEQYGAIAVSPNTRDSGIVINASSSKEAREDALGYCTSNGARVCIVIVESQECLALSEDPAAWGEASGWGTFSAWGAASGPTMESAILRANRDAISDGANSPTPLVWGCNGDETVYSNEKRPISTSQDNDFYHRQQQQYETQQEDARRRDEDHHRREQEEYSRQQQQQERDRQYQQQQEQYRQQQENQIRQQQQQY